MVGQLNFGEAAVVGGNNLFGSSPPAKDPSSELERRYAAPTNLSSPSQIEAGFFSFPTLHLLITVIYCLPKGRGGRSDENHNSAQFDGTDL